MQQRLFYWLIISIWMLFMTGCGVKSSNTNIAGSLTEGKTSIEIFHSKKIGDYKLSIYSPSVKEPSQGWPVIYLLDGDSFFKQVSEIVSQQAVIVSIDYPTINRRALDYLPRPPELTLEILSNGKINFPEAFGGADDFLSFLQTELKPDISKRLSVDPNRQIIFGHSYGGLFVLHTLFTQPNVFSDYIASSPSIWFSGRYMMQEMAFFITQPDQLQLHQLKTLRISVGEFEQSLNGQEGFSSKHEKFLRLKHMQKRRMVDNTKELAQMLQQSDINNLNTTYRIYPQQTHQSVPLVVLQDSLPIILHK